MKRAIILLAVATVPALLFLNVWQVFRYDRLRREIVALEEEQGYWIEENKRLMIGIEVLSSPKRIDELASDQVELVKPEEHRELRVRIVSPESNDG